MVRAINKMKKKLVGISNILPNYIDSSKHGALICEPLECSLGNFDGKVDEILPSSKDIFYALNNRLLQDVEGNKSRVYTYNGVSSLTYFDTPLLKLVSKIQGDYSVHLSCRANRDDQYVQSQSSNTSSSAGRR